MRMPTLLHDVLELLLKHVLDEASPAEIAKIIEDRGGEGAHTIHLSHFTAR